MDSNTRTHNIQKVSTGILGLDLITAGGLPQGRTTLVTGTAGSAKTVMAAQFLAEGIRQADENGVFITFEETPEDIRRNMLDLGWDIREWEESGRWIFVDGSHQPPGDEIVTGAFDFDGLWARIEHAIAKIDARRVAMDSLGAVFSQFTDRALVRRELFRLATGLKAKRLTALLTAERIEEYGRIARYDVEEFVADNVIILRNVLEAEKRRRTVEVLKFRGTFHHKGEYPFTIIPGRGIVVIPLTGLELKQSSTNARIPSGKKELDSMCGGGFFRDSIILISGATGTGKTLLVTEFTDAGIRNQEKCLFFAFEESREQLLRNAAGWGMGFEESETDGRLQIICNYPEIMGLEDHLLHMKEAIEDFKPDRVVVDSLSALERVATVTGYREFVIGLTAFIKHLNIAGIFTSTTPSLMGGTSVTESHISTITDSIILLRYVELFGEMRRGITILKMRGSIHDKVIREFVIDGQGMHIGKPFHNVSGIIAGNPSCLSPAAEMDRIGDLFRKASET